MAETPRLAGVPHSGGDAVDGDHQRPSRARVRLTPQAAKQLDLHQIQRIDVRIPHIDRAPDHRRGLEQLGVSGHVEHAAESHAPAGPAARPRSPGGQAAPAADRTRRRFGRRLSPAPSRSTRSRTGSAASPDTSPSADRARHARRRDRWPRRRRATRPASAASASRQTARGWPEARAMPPSAPRRAGRLPRFSSSISDSGVAAWK